VAFVAFVQAGLTLPDPAAERRVPTFAASDEYIATLGARVACGLEEVPKVERAWKSLNQYEYENPVRNAAIRAAYESGSYTLKAIGDHFGLHYATVSRIARANRATDVAIQDLTP
jgi:hypothetical protein